MTLDETLLAAHHEAGHAIMAVLLGLPVRRVTLSYALVLHPSIPGNHKFNRSAARDEAAICMAGPIAEAIHRHGADNIALRPRWDRMKGGDAERYRELATTLANATGRRRDDVLNDLAVQTWETLKAWENWMLVQDLAAELIEQRVLSRGSVAQIVRRSREGFTPTAAEVKRGAELVKRAAVAGMV